MRKRRRPSIAQKIFETPPGGTLPIHSRHTRTHYIHPSPNISPAVYIHQRRARCVLTAARILPNRRPPHFSASPGLSRVSMPPRTACAATNMTAVKAATIAHTKNSAPQALPHSGGVNPPTSVLPSSRFLMGFLGLGTLGSFIVRPGNQKCQALSRVSRTTPLRKRTRGIYPLRGSYSASCSALDTVSSLARSLEALLPELR